MWRDTHHWGLSPGHRRIVHRLISYDHTILCRGPHSWLLSLPCSLLFSVWADTRIHLNLVEDSGTDNPAVQAAGGTVGTLGAFVCASDVSGGVTLEFDLEDGLFSG